MSLKPAEEVKFWKCPCCGGGLRSFPRDKTVVCLSCNRSYPAIVNDDGVIPCLLPSYEDYFVPDPGLSFSEAWTLANDLSKQTGSFRQLVDYYYEALRDRIPKSLFDYYRNIVRDRKVGDNSDEISGASLCMNVVKTYFPKINYCLEIGSGWGFSLAAARKHYLRDAFVAGIDLCPPILVLSQRLFSEHGLGKIDLAVADCSFGIPVEPAIVDFCFASCVVEHIKDQTALMKQIDKILSPNSTLYFTVPARYNIFPEPHFNLRFLGFYPSFIKKRVISRAHNVRIEDIEDIYQYSFKSIRKLLENNFPGDYLSARLLKSGVNSSFIYSLLNKYAPPFVSSFLFGTAWECLVYRDQGSTRTDIRRGAVYR